jgi:DNA uptake protein ComE-like DNA-binding protein
MTRSTPWRAIALAGLVSTSALSACGGAEEAPEGEAAPAAEAPAAPPPAAPAGAFLDPNTASEAELAAAPGMDATRAAAVVAGRPYQNMTAVDAALGSGLSDEQKDALYARVWMPLDLNSATEEEILLIPGVGDRMAHEFEEYRPYDSMERFRREIGKYVDSTEVARLEQYVTIR